MAPWPGFTSAQNFETSSEHAFLSTANALAPNIRPIQMTPAITAAKYNLLTRFINSSFISCCLLLRLFSFRITDGRKGLNGRL
jgi:hypothetical protein